ncbi:MAG: hypothetical protein AAF244_02615 [Pseudomonadota bacterium]
MSDFSAKKNDDKSKEISGRIEISAKRAKDMNVSVDSKAARSKKLDETLEKLSASQSEVKSENKEEKAFAIESKTGLKKLRISSPAEESKEDVASPFPQVRAQKLSSFSEAMPVLDNAEDLSNIFEPQPVGRSIGYLVATATGLFLTAAWFTLCGNYIANSMEWSNLFAQQPHILGGFMAGILAPVAMVWMIIAFIQRGSDVRHYSRTLRREMHTTLFANKNNAGMFEKDLNKLMGQASNFSKTSKATLHSIQKARLGLRNDMNNFSTLAKELEDKKIMFDEGNFDGLKDWDEKISKFIDRADKIEALLSDEHLKFNKTEEFMKSVQALIDHTENMDERVEARMDNLTKVMDGLNEKIKSIETAEQDAAAKLTSLNTSSELTIENIEKSVEKLSDSLKSIQAVSDTVNVDVQKFSDTAASQKADLEKVRSGLDDRVQALELTLKTPIEKLERVVEQANSRHDEIDRALEKRIEALNETADKAVEKSQTIRTNLRDTVQEMSGFAGRLGGYSKTAHSQMAEQVAAFEKSINETIVRIEDAGANIKSQTSGLSEATKHAADELSKLEGNISTHRQNVKSDTSGLFDDLKSYNDNIKANTAEIANSANEAKGSLEEASKRLEETAGIIVPTAKKATDEMNATSDRFEEISSNFEKKTKTNLENLQSINVIFDKTLEDLKSSTTDASIMLEKSGSKLNQYVDNIDQASNQARAKIEDMGRLVKDQTDLVSLNADQAVLKIETVQQTLNDQNNDLSSLVSEAQIHIEEAGKEFAKRISEIEGSSAKAIVQFMDVNEKAKGQQDFLKEMSEVTNEQISQMVDRFKKQIGGMTKDASAALTELNKSNEGFAENNRKMENQIHNSLIAAKKHNADIARQMREMVDNSETATKSITDSVEQLSTNMGSLTQSANDISKKVESARNILESETEHMADVSIKASRLVEEAAQSYQKQSATLFKASEEATANIDKIREKEFRTQRDSFLSNAKYLLESLHSLSVDLTRSLDGRIQEKAWKAYQAGDVAIFTRQIVENKAQLSEKKLADKYAKDNEFRTYTNRFIRQFEEVYQNSMENDFGDLLAATFATSDVGKLYEILCHIVAHKNIIQGKHIR